MHVFVSFVLITGLSVLLIVGLLRVIRDLLSRDVFAAPSSPNEAHEEIAEDAMLSGPAGIADLRASLRRTNCRD
jgi:hypothetical protein